MDILSKFSYISALRPSWGTLFLATLLIFSFLAAFKLQRGGVLRHIIGIYMAIAVFNFLPFLNIEVGGLKIDDYPLIKIILFISMFLLFALLLSRSSLALLNRERGTLFSTIVLAVLGTGLFLSTVSVMMPADVREELHAGIQVLFVNETARFGWVLAPIIAIVFIG